MPMAICLGLFRGNRRIMPSKHGWKGFIAVVVIGITAIIGAITAWRFLKRN